MREISGSEKRIDKWRNGGAAGQGEKPAQQHKRNHNRRQYQFFPLNEKNRQLSDGSQNTLKPIAPLMAADKSSYQGSGGLCNLTSKITQAVRPLLN